MDLGSRVDGIDNVVERRKVTMPALDSRVLVAVCTPAVTVVGDFEVKALRERVSEMVLVVIDPPAVAVPDVLPVPGGTDPRPVRVDFDTVVPVHISGQY